MKNHIGTTVAILFGVLALLAGLSQQTALSITGLIIIVGASACRSAKKRKIGAVGASTLRLSMEISAILIVILAIVAQKGLAKLIVEDPVPNLIIPAWVVIAYLYVFIGARKSKNQADDNL